MFSRFGMALLATGFVTLQASSIIDVVPNANTSVGGNAEQFEVFGEGSAAASYTFQWQLAASQLTSLIGDPLTAIGFRLLPGAATIPGPTTITSFDLELSPAVNSIGSLSVTQANNIGAGGVTVYNAPLTLGTLTGAPGASPFFLINFSTPYTYTGGDLVVTETILGGSTFAVDANVPDGNGDTSALARTEFFNYPITEFQATANVAATPEPGTLLSLAGGLFAFGALRFRARKF
jgi:hypothetical protein